MKKRRKKMIAPLVISALLILYYLIYFAVLFVLINSFWKYLLGIIPAAAAAVTIAVCHDRIKEIRSGEEDDLSQY